MPTPTQPPIDESDSRRSLDPGLQVGSLTVEIGGTELIDQLEFLWLSLFDHHLSIGAGGLPTIQHAQSWPRRRQLYESLLHKPGAFVVLARGNGRPIGYALAHTHPGADDTWPTGPVIGEIESLAVAPEERGHGVGTSLLDATEKQLAARGVHDIKLSVITGNATAMRFYHRRGMTPVMTTYLKLRRQC